MDYLNALQCVDEMVADALALHAEHGFALVGGPERMRGVCAAAVDLWCRSGNAQPTVGSPR